MSIMSTYTKETVWTVRSNDEPESDSEEQNFAQNSSGPSVYGKGICPKT